MSRMGTTGAAHQSEASKPPAAIRSTVARKASPNRPSARWVYQSQGNYTRSSIALRKRAGPPEQRSCERLCAHPLAAAHPASDENRDPSLRPESALPRTVRPIRGRLDGAQVWKQEVAEAFASLSEALGCSTGNWRNREQGRQATPSRMTCPR